MRYAILFSGMSFRRHVNGLEYGYRTLVDRLGFVPDNIQVLNYDGSLLARGDPDDEPCNVWPGDGTPYRMVVNAPGSREAFQHALRSLGKQLTAGDQVFINTTGHGGHHGDERGPDLITYPHCSRYGRDEFCADLAMLPPHQSLVVLMAQCFSGGFNQAVVDSSPAAATFIAAATSEMRPSFMSFHDGNWDSFQRNWLEALAGRVTVQEAFTYASTCPGRNPYDSPEFAARPASAGALTLG